jgi:hypothetical protein
LRAGTACKHLDGDSRHVDHVPFPAEALQDS